MEYKYDSQTISPRKAFYQHCNGNVSGHFATSLLTVNCQLSTVNWIHTFSAKEKDTETGLSYFGSRYYSSDLSIGLQSTMARCRKEDGKEHKTIKEQAKQAFLRQLSVSSSIVVR